MSAVAELYGKALWGNVGQERWERGGGLLGVRIGFSFQCDVICVARLRRRSRVLVKARTQP